jgi:hypothetical protein
VRRSRKEDNCAHLSCSLQESRTPFFVLCARRGAIASSAWYGLRMATASKTHSRAFDATKGEEDKGRRSIWFGTKRLKKYDPNQMRRSHLPKFCFPVLCGRTHSPIE